MKRFSTLLMGLALSAAAAMAQTQDIPTDTSGAYSLDQCVEYAIQHSIAIQNATLDQQVAQAKVRETRGIGLPQISAAGSIIHNPKLPRFFTTYVDQAHRAPGAISFISDSIANLVGLKNGNVVAATNFFQLKASAGLSVTVNQMIFNGSYLVGLKASKTFRELSQRAANQTREQIIVQVTKAYYAVIVNKERTRLFTDNINRVDSLLKNTKALNQNGFSESIDVDRIQVSLNNLISDRDKFLNLNELGIELLKFQMNYPMEANLHVSGDIKDIPVENPIETYKQNWDFKQRPDYQTLETNRKIQELVIKNKYAAGMPTLNVFGTYGYNTQSPNLSGIFKTNTAIKDEGGAGPDKYYDYSQFGLNLNIPIFSGGQRHYQLQQEKLNLLKIQNNYRSLNNTINVDVKQSTTNFNNALKTLTAQQANMELAGKVARVTKIKYEQGVGSNLEVVDAENSLRQAQTNYYNALYDVLVARVDIDKAFGKILPNYPVAQQ